MENTIKNSDVSARISAKTCGNKLKIDKSSRKNALSNCEKMKGGIQNVQ